MNVQELIEELYSIINKQADAVDLEVILETTAMESTVYSIAISDRALYLIGPDR